MNLNDVIRRFALISGLEGEELSHWLPVCVDAMAEVHNLATAKALSEEASCRRLSSLAGVLAYYRYVMYAGENVKSFGAGSVSVTYRDDTLKSAEKMWETELQAVSELLTPSDFCFQRVRV